MTAMSVASAPSMVAAAHSEHGQELRQLGQLGDAVTPFVDLISRSGHDVRLYCSIPTWNPSSDTCCDLHDLHELRSRCLKFIHRVINDLKALDISASYRLVPSNSSLCLVCALPPGLTTSRVQSTTIRLQSSALQAMKNAKMNKRDNVTVVADLAYPSLIIS